MFILEFKLATCCKIFRRVSLQFIIWAGGRAQRMCLSCSIVQSTYPSLIHPIFLNQIFTKSLLQKVFLPETGLKRAIRAHLAFALPSLNTLNGIHEKALVMYTLYFEYVSQVICFQKHVYRIIKLLVCRDPVYSLPGPNIILIEYVTCPHIQFINQVVLGKSDDTRTFTLI